MRILVTLVTFLAFASPAAAGPVVKTSYNTSLKTTILVDARGMTLYMYVSDYKGSAICVDDPSYHCSRHWPPLLTTGTPVAKGGAHQSLLGTVKRTDGTTQVTYAGHPLYTYKLPYSGFADRKPGDVHGQNFYSLWYVLSPAGKVIKKHA